MPERYWEYSKRYWECSKRKCKWTGNDEEKSSVPDKIHSFVEHKICPKCGNDSFYEMTGKKLEKHLKEKEIRSEEMQNDQYENYRKKTIQRMRPYIPNEDLTGVSVSKEDTPEEGGMIAIGYDNGALWYVSRQFFNENYELVSE